jgi:hypothetical protein
MIEAGDNSGAESTGDLEKVVSSVDQRTGVQLDASAAGEKIAVLDEGDADADSVMATPPGLVKEQSAIAASEPKIIEEGSPFTSQESASIVKPDAQPTLEAAETTEKKPPKPEKVATALVVNVAEVGIKDSGRGPIAPLPGQTAKGPVEKTKETVSVQLAPQVNQQDGKDQVHDDGAKSKEKDIVKTKEQLQKKIPEQPSESEKSLSQVKELRNNSIEKATPGTVWAPESPPYGFKVETLSKASAPVSTYLAFADTAEVAKGVIGRVYKKDKVRTVASQDELKPTEILLDVDVHVAVPRAALDKLHRKGREVRPGRFPKEEREAFAKGLQAAVRKEFAPGWESLPRRFIDSQKKLYQIVAFGSGGKSVDLYNFTPTRIDKEQIGRVANAIREMSDRTGGAIFEMLNTIAIVSTDNPAVAEKNENGEYTSVNWGAAYGGAVALSECLFNPNARSPVVTARDPARTELYTEIDHDNPFSVAGDKLQLTVFHELTHVIELKGDAYDHHIRRLYGTMVGWESEPGESGRQLQRGYVKNPVVYGRANEVEDLAVTAEAEFAGGEQWAKYDTSRHLGLRAVWAQRHGGMFGPTFVTAKEMPLPRWPSKIGILPRVPLAIKPTYIYTPYEPGSNKLR